MLWLNNSTEVLALKLRDVVDALDVGIYAFLGACLFAYILYEIGSLAWNSGSIAARGLVSLVAVGSGGLLIRDLVRGRMGIFSKMVGWTWLLLIAAVVILDLWSTF